MKNGLLRNELFVCDHFESSAYDEKDIMGFSVRHAFNPVRIDRVVLFHISSLMIRTISSLLKTSLTVSIASARVALARGTFSFFSRSAETVHLR